MRGAQAPQPQGSKFLHDREINPNVQKKMKEERDSGNRHLKKWSAADWGEEEKLEVLDTSDVKGKNGKYATWDQFKVNEEKFGYKSTFKNDLSQYTTKLDMKSLTKQQVEKATKTANEINSADFRTLDIEEDAEGDFIYQADVDDAGLSTALKDALSSSSGDPGAPTHLSALDPNGICPFSGRQCGCAEALASHLAQALSPDAPGDDQAYDFGTKILLEMTKQKSWREMQESIKLPFDVNVIVEEMGIEDDAKVEAVVSKLALAKRWKSKNMLKHYRILEAIAVALTVEYFS
jgi:hypothetical protein